VVRVPFVRLARERLARPVVANIIALGLIVRLTRVVSEEAAEQAILARVPRGTEELNRRAFHLGLEVANEAATAPVA
jgi:2-oxoglutarate ferredoxin oxidoreductase subunit gamma